MDTQILDKYADLLVNYCLELKKGETVNVKSSRLAEPLLIRFYERAIKAGAHPQMNISLENQEKLYYKNASEEQLEYVSPISKYIMEYFDAYIVIRAPFDLEELKDVAESKIRKVRMAHKEIREVYMKRTGSGEMKRSLCEFPTETGAQHAGMSFEEYQHFVFNACRLYEDDPIAEWLKVREEQQRIVDFLNQCEWVEYKGENIDVKFSTKGRTWINSDGRSNMPSGEVFSSPIEDTMEGWVKFTVPAIYSGKQVEGIELKMKDGEVTEWDAEKGKAVLDEIFSIPGARRFGEVAIGTNYKVQQFTKNILFDEKIGGTVHMAIGQSYYHTGGKNQSSIHWDMITDMKKDGQVLADGKLIYEKGKFLI